MFDTQKIDQIIDNALREDIKTGDVTTLWLILPSTTALAQIIAQENGFLAGLEIAKKVFVQAGQYSQADPNIKLEFKSLIKDGVKIKKGQVLAKIGGPARTILTAERTALNFLQRMSGIATLTNQFAAKTKGTKAKILDTRKTAPGLRTLDKLAVRVGGGENHRFGLYDMVLVKDNHIRAVGGISKAVKLINKYNDKNLFAEFEVDNLLQLDQALHAGAKRILLDNFTLENIKKAVRLNNSRAVLEVSGGVSLANVAQIAKTGVDYISVGALTHSAPALDMGIQIE